MSRSKKKPQHGTHPNLIMKLPPELRNRIYELVLVKDDVIVNKFLVGKRNKFPPKRNRGGRNGLLRASKQIRAEALPLYFGRNTFQFHMSFTRWDVGILAKAFRNLMETCGNKPFHEITFHLHNRHVLVDLQNIRPLVDLVHSGHLILLQCREQEETPDLRSCLHNSRDIFSRILFPTDKQEFERWTDEISATHKLFHTKSLPTNAGLVLDILLRLGAQSRWSKQAREDYAAIWSTITMASNCGHIILGLAGHFVF